MENENLLTSDVKYLEEGLKVLEELERARERRNNLTLQLKGLERDIAGEEKLVRDEVDITVKKRREEISASFDKEIRKDQDKIRKIKADRDKAKTRGVAGRIEMETADIREENQQIQMEIKSIMKESRLPRFCNQKWYFLLFYPKGIDGILMLLVLAVVMYALPYAICHLAKLQRLPAVLGVSAACGMVFFLLYQFIHNLTRGSKWNAVRQIRALRDKTAANHKKVRAIRNAIYKDRDEQSYNLEGFDKEIQELEEEVKNTLSEKQEALTAFEDVTKKMLIEEIEGRNKDKILALQDNQKEAASGLKDAETLVKDIHKHLTASYGVFLGKDYVNEEAMREMILLMQEENLSTVAEALALYKSER